MSEWKKVNLVDVTSRLGDGLHGTPKYDDNGEYYFINGNNLQNGKIIIKDDTKKISEKEYLKIKKELNDRTVLVAINGTLGNVGLYANEKIALGKSACYFNINEDVDKAFIRYVMESSHFQMYAQLFATGATIKNLSLKAMRQYPFSLPPLQTQKKIAKILSNYDDLIENNLKRIKLLEESARLTYEEWFLRFRIDGKKLEIDSATGLPFGWKKRKLKDITRYVARGISPKYVEENGVIVLNQKCIRDNFVNIDLGRLHSLDKKVSQEKKLQFGDVLINSTGTGTLGRVAQIFEIIEDVTVDSHVSIVRANEMISPYILGRTLEYLEEYITNLGKGATNQQELGRADLESLVQVVIPAVDYQEKYEECVAPIFKVINNLRKENQLLKEARDILLPHLMIGVIDVEKMDGI